MGSNNVVQQKQIQQYENEVTNIFIDKFNLKYDPPESINPQDIIETPQL